MATTNPGTEQKKASGLLTIFIFASFLLAQLGALFIYPGLDLYGNYGFLTCDLIGLSLTVVFGVVNLENTFATNLDWKTYIGFLTIIYNIVFAALFVSTGNK